jgi:4-amino-4-deoxy-L-arabinose transferase-like glycosyltransferase
MTVTEAPLDDPAVADIEQAAPPRSGSAAPPSPPSPEGSRPGRWSARRITVHGWITAAIGALAALLYTWSLSANGYANDYYAAAVKSASVSWKALFFGAIDPGSFITVDKPPASLWLMGLSARLFGFSSWSMLLPEALCGVASVLLLHHLVKKWAGPIAAHIAAIAFAVTPVAVLMFRFNNPDALLTFLCLAAAWAVWKALETAKTRYLVLSGALVGLAFNTKMLQAFVVLPAFVLVYLVAGQPRLLKRIGQLCAGLAALVVSASWWVAIVALTPASSRPYIGSTTDNSILSLVFGYNGLSRIFGQGGPAGGAGPGGGGGVGGGAGFGGAAGWLRLFNSENAGQISWLLPFAAVGLLAGLWVTRKGRRTDLGRAGWLLWGGWALVTFTVFSKAQGIFHAYYSVQLAPAAAALAGAGGLALWRLGRTHRWLRWVLPASIILTAAWAVALLDLTPTYLPWLRPAIVVGAVLATAGLWLGGVLRHRLLVGVAAGIAVLTLLAGPTAYSITTVRTPATGSIVLAGPTTSGTGRGGFGGPGGGGGFAGPGGGASTTETALVDYLEANRGDATYLVAAFGSQSSSSIIIASGQPVVTIGGFNGSDPAPTLAQFEQLVSSGQLRYVLIGGGGGGGGGGFGGPGGNGTTGDISSWVTQHGTAVPASAYGGSGSGGTLYDLQGATS